MRIKRFNEMMDNKFNYDHIIRTMVKNHGWGNGCIDYVNDFESNSEYFLNPQNDNEYAEQFHIYLTDLQTGQLRGQLQNKHNLRQGKWKLGTQVNRQVNWYSKLT
jgi:hypothetical protein